MCQCVRRPPTKPIAHVVMIYAEINSGAWSCSSQRKTFIARNAVAAQIFPTWGNCNVSRRGGRSRGCTGILGVKSDFKLLLYGDVQVHDYRIHIADAFQRPHQPATRRQNIPSATDDLIVSEVSTNCPFDDNVDVPDCSGHELTYTDALLLPVSKIVSMARLDQLYLIDSSCSRKFHRRRIWWSAWNR